MFDNPQQIGIRCLHELIDPVKEFYLRIAAHLAKHSRSLERLVSDGVQFSKKDCGFDFGHGSRLVNARFCGMLLPSRICYRALPGALCPRTDNGIAVRASDFHPKIPANRMQQSVPSCVILRVEDRILGILRKFLALRPAREPEPPGLAESCRRNLRGLDDALHIP
jgi:hypothetical protein